MPVVPKPPNAPPPFGREGGRVIFGSLIPKRDGPIEKIPEEIQPMSTDVGLILDAVAFAAEKHRNQHRKDAEGSPYINHPVSLARTLLVTGGVNDPQILAAALLHDTIEDTDTTAAELKQRFGDRVASIVQEVTDDKSLPKDERKRRQESEGYKKSAEAKLVKIADKISNLRDILAYPPTDWPHDRKVRYFDWARRVVDAMFPEGEELDVEAQALIAEFQRVFDLGQQVFRSTRV